MSSKFIKATSGWIPVSVLLLLAAAFVTGNPRATAPAGTQVGEAPLTELHGQIRSTLRDVDSVRYLMDSLVDVPERVELIIDAGIPSGTKAPGRSKLLQGFDHG